jgi:dihydroxy-acid dehydratase
MNKAQVGISRYISSIPKLTIVCMLQFGISLTDSWYEGNPCNMHLLALGRKVKEGVQKAGLIGYQFNTIGVRYTYHVRR